MQLHELKKVYKDKARRRIGRGGKRGTYSGKGMKGQKSRAGHKIRPAIRDFIIRLPKRRGFKFRSIQLKPAVINLHVLERHFKSGDVVSPQILSQKGLIKRIKGILPEVKILGDGELKKKLIFRNCVFSKSAKIKSSK